MKKHKQLTKIPRKVWCILFCLVLFAQALHAQRTITGTVIDAGDRQSIPGVQIVVKGTTIGTTTDLNGRYSLNVPNEATTLVFSFMGMATQEIEIGAGTTIDVTLRSDAAMLQEVVVTGFREVSAEAYTGAAFVMTDQSIRSRPFGSVDEALRGNAPGLISTSSGQPGQMAEIRLRGVGSMNADNQPLYVVDGVVWDMGNQSGSAQSPVNPLTTLNPMDIANITILRDAASAALYGSRGANGVIVITTHTGRAGDRPQINFMSQAGVAAMLMRPNLVNGRQFAELWTEAQMHYLVLEEGRRRGDLPESLSEGRFMLAGFLKDLYEDKDGHLFYGLNYNQWMKRAQQDFNNRFAIPVGDGTYHNYDFFGADRDKLPNTSWFDEITRIAPFVQTDFSISGGNRDFRSFISLGYFNQQGTIINSQLQRYSLRVRLSGGHDKQRINWGLNNALSYSMQSGPRLSGANFDMPQYTASVIPSVVPVYLEDGSYNYNFPQNLMFSNNPVAAASLNRNDRPQTRIFMQGYVQVNNILPGLRFRTTNTMNYNLARRTEYAHGDFGAGSAVGGQLLNRDSHNRRFTSTNLFTYDQNWGGVHRLNVIAGAEFEDWSNRFNQLIVANFPSNDHHSASLGSEIIDWSGGGTGYSQLGLLTSIDYSYKFRYMLTASIRRDGSSRFHPDHRWGNFWSLAGAWRISNESFFRDLVPSKYVNNMRLRVSYGESGTLPDQYFHWREAYNNNSYMGQTGARQTYIPSPELTWEGNRIWNFGIDMRLFNERFRFSAEYFDRKSKDLLRDVNISMASGFRTMLMNTSAGIHNTGFEFELSGTVFERGKHSLDFNFNIATLKAVYYGLETAEWDGTQRQWIANGLSVNAWRLRRWAGPDYQIGTRTFWTAGAWNSGAVSSATTLFHVDGHQGIPKFTGGLSMTYSYGPFALSTLMSYGGGHHIFDHLGGQITSTDGTFDNYSISVDQLNRWTPLNRNASAPMRLHSESHQSRYDRFLYKGDYLKIQSIRLQYGLPKNVVDKLKMRSALVFAQTENPFIFSHIPGYDPELSIDGYRLLDSYPPATTFLIGISLSF